MINTLIFAIFSFASGSGLCSMLFKNMYFIRMAAIYAAIFAISIFTGNKYLAFSLIAILCLYVVNKNPKDIIYYYLILLPAFPLSVKWLVAAPGVDTLFIFDHHRVVILCLFGPAFLKILSSRGSLLGSSSNYSGLIDRFLLCFLFLICIVHFRDHNITSGFRRSMLTFVDIWIPYIVISRMVRNIKVVLLVVLFTAVIFSILSALELIFSYRFYDQITRQMGGGFTIPSFRGGALRVYAFTGNPLTLGFFLSFSVLIAFKVRSLIKCPSFTPWLLIFILYIGIEASGSRSPFATNVLAVGILFWWGLGRKGVSDTATFVLITVVVGAYWFFTSGIDLVFSLDSEGEQGNFYYRYALIINSMDAIGRNFWFGASPNEYLSNPVLLNSLQGQGIVDVTNAYLGVVLNLGAIGLFLFVGIWTLVIKSLYRTLGPSSEASLLMALCVNVMLGLFITSAISYVSIYSWVLVALVSGFVRNNTP